MEVKIGVTHANRELTLDTSQTPAEIQAAVTEALNSDERLLTLTDDRGRTVFVPAEKLAYVEVTGATPRRLGFAG